MPKDFDRSRRVADVLQREVARLIQENFKDPRVGMVTVSSVELTRDLLYAKVFITVFEEEKLATTLERLNEGVGFFRSHLAKVLHTRTTPKIKFYYDKSVMEGYRMGRLIHKALDNPESADE